MTTHDWQVLHDVLDVSFSALGAVATAAAVITALWIALRDEHRRRVEGLSDQADKVSAWTTDEGIAGIGTSVGIRLLNASDQPVYRVRFTPVERIGSRIRGMSHWGPYGDTRLVGTLPPGATDQASGPLTGPIELNALGINLTFFDAHGVEWWRTPDGRLMRSQDGGNVLSLEDSYQETFDAMHPGWRPRRHWTWWRRVIRLVRGSRRQS